MTARLYWCSTDDHEEDWFVVARDTEEATQAFAAWEGYEVDEVATKELDPISPADTSSLLFRRTQSYLPAIADLPLLQALGGQLLSIRSPLVLKLGDHVFVQGAPDWEQRKRMDDALEARGRGRPNGTRRATAPS